MKIAGLAVALTQSLLSVLRKDVTELSALKQLFSTMLSALPTLATFAPLIALLLRLPIKPCHGKSTPFHALSQQKVLKPTPQMAIPCLKSAPCCLAAGPPLLLRCTEDRKGP